MAVTGTASAEPVSIASWEQCLDGNFCVWEYKNANQGAIGGHFAYFKIGSDNLARPIGNFVFNDKISSVWNRMARCGAPTRTRSTSHSLRGRSETGGATRRTTAWTT
jgi:hypothetical protein